MPKQFWLMKSEPGEVSFDDVWNMPDRTISWWGIRNYQARNLMRDVMKVGDEVLFYHSSCPQPGIAGLASIVSATYPDALQFDPHSPYFDSRSTVENPRWLARDVRAEQPLELIPLARLRECAELSRMRVLARGNRLSITPVSPQEYEFIVKQLAKPRTTA